jgi:hypothetical protein
VPCDPWHPATNFHICWLPLGTMTQKQICALLQDIQMSFGATPTRTRISLFLVELPLSTK